MKILRIITNRPYYYDRSNLLDIIKKYTPDPNHKSLGKCTSGFLIRYCNDTSTLLPYRYTKEYICYEDLTQDVVGKIVDWALIRGKDNKSGMSKGTIRTYLSYIKVALKRAFDLGLINDEWRFEYPERASIHTRGHFIPSDEYMQMLFNFEPSTTFNFTERMKKTLLYFELSYRLEGISIPDLSNLKKHNLTENKIKITRINTFRNTQPKEIILTDRAKELINILKNKNEESPYLFDILSPEMTSIRKKQITKAFIIESNRNLQRIFEIKITMHLAGMPYKYKL